MRWHEEKKFEVGDIRVVERFLWKKTHLPVGDDSLLLYPNSKFAKEWRWLEFACVKQMYVPDGKWVSLLTTNPAYYKWIDVCWADKDWPRN